MARDEDHLPTEGWFEESGERPVSEEDLTEEEPADLLQPPPEALPGSAALSAGERELSPGPVRPLTPDLALLPAEHQWPVWTLGPGASLERAEDLLIIADPERAYQTLSSLHELGIKISIDDFGTGYTSMGHLKRLPVSSLKIDRSFVSNMESDENDALIVNTVAGLAHDLGMTVVAEGVEDAETLLTLKVLRCDFAQGFHICRPLPVESITEWLQR